ncbi:MAG TPA: prolyl oligopeptidase family serine peptidase [Candidatus Acidoferrales bacterium]|nr:prolyl oligopeptidase family serine peptidase [Candidatus Acidoferrales bacterium]
MKLATTVAITMFPLLIKSQPLNYPVTRRDTLVENYFGTKVPAPYQWMEDQESPAVDAWVEAENKITFDYLDKISIRDSIRARITKLWNYEKVGVPNREGGLLFYSKNSGLQNQSPVFRQKSLASKPEMILDPNKLSPDGSLALLDYQASPNGKLLCYAISQGGSDWEELHVRDLASGKDLPDTVHWVKFSGLSWTNDNGGFFYSRFPEPKNGEVLTTEAVGQQLFYHKVGTPQTEDKMFYDLKDYPGWYVSGGVTDDGRFLFIYLNKGTESKNKVFYVDLKDPKHPDLSSPVKPLFGIDNAEYYPLGNVGTKIIMQTTLDAPNRRIVSFDIGKPDSIGWKMVIAEAKNVIEQSLLAGGKIVVRYLVDAKSEVEFYSLNGKHDGTLKFPGIGTVDGLTGRYDTPELFYAYTSFLYPTTVFRHDFKTGKDVTFQPPHVDFDPKGYETKQVFYQSKDGTRIPMFITAKKGIKLDGTNPTLLYAYGGFNISITPAFSITNVTWLEMGGVYAVANLRGGGEYGETWHHAGMLEKKQNVFDDFIAAAEFLIKEKYTSTPKLGIEGYSNGGLLVGSCETQRPDLYGAAYAGAGVMDMLRYQKFSAGVGWVPEYGSSDDSTDFQYLIKYSPVQNVRPGICYPPTIVTTADHDDRVVPSHSYKFIAQMQHNQACNNPVLIRVETKTSHGYMPTDKRIAQAADVLAFMAHNLGIKDPPAALRH